MEINKVHKGDCYELIKQIPDKSIDLIITDPPYEIGAKGCGLAGDRAYLKEITTKVLDKGFDFNVLKQEFKRILKTMNIYIFCSKAQLKEYIDWVYEEDYNWVLICWHKKNPTPLTNNNFLPDTEYVIHAWKDLKLKGDYDSKKKFYVSNIEKNSFNHPTVKPLNIIRNFLKNSSQEGDVVLDCFAGSGTTLLGAKELGRKFIGFEINEDYCKIAEKRLEQETLTIFS